MDESHEKEKKESRKVPLAKQKWVIRDACFVFLYYLFGVLVLCYLEEWSAAKAFYFLSMTFTTVGYGDVHPQKFSGRWFIVFDAPLGIVIIFTIVARYMGYIQDRIRRFSEFLLEICGKGLVDTHDLPIEKYSPAEVSKILSYKRRIVLAAMPMVFVLAFFVVFAAYLTTSETNDLSWSKAVYFVMVTCTTIGYGDVTIAHDRGWRIIVLSLYTILTVVVFANCISELVDIRRRYLLRLGKIVPKPDDLEEILLAKYVDLSPDEIERGVEPVITEADYVMQTLVNARLVDEQVLFAIRRTFHWTAINGYTELHSFHRKTMLSAKDLHAGIYASPKDVDPEDPLQHLFTNFEAWRKGYWEPKIAATRAKKNERFSITIRTPRDLLKNLAKPLTPLRHLLHRGAGSHDDARRSLERELSDGLADPESP